MKTPPALSPNRDDTLLTSPLALRLFHEVARDLPIIDFHNHLDVAGLAQDRTLPNLAQLWVAADPYKHRAMRIAGVPESEITGDGSDREKYDRWAATLPLALGNPLQAWARLELKRYFDLDLVLSPATAGQVWTEANARLAQPTHTSRGLLARGGVAVACTSDSLLDDLSAHASLARSDYEVRVLPSLRADDLTAIDSANYPAWLARLANLTDVAIRDYASFCAAVAVRLDAFDALGCRLADHALDDFRYASPVSPSDTATLFARRLAGEALDAGALLRLRSGLLVYLGGEYARRGWVLQLHLNAHRHTSTRLRKLAGPAGGYAALGNPTDIPALCALLDGLEQGPGLPRTVLYPLNPTDYAALATLTGSYAADGVPGLVQLGPAWWFNDHDIGIRQHLDVLSRYGLLATFIGMTTDSRSLLSMVRHEYFRRVLCAWLGEQASAGHVSADFETLAPVVRAVCHDNAARFLRL